MDKDDYKGRVLDVRQDIQIKKREMGPALGYNYDLLSDEQLSDIVQYNIFPNAVLVLNPRNFGSCGRGQELGIRTNATGINSHSGCCQI